MNNFIDIPANLIIGIPEIDRRHLEIAELMNCLFEEVVNLNNLLIEIPGSRFSYPQLTKMDSHYGSNPPKRRITRLLDSLVNATRTHFQSEEEIMLALKFQGLSGHRREHLMLLAELSVLVRSYNGGIRPIGREELKSLKAWFLGHLSGSDSEIGRYYSKMNMIHERHK